MKQKLTLLFSLLVYSCASGQPTDSKPAESGSQVAAVDKKSQAKNTKSIDTKDPNARSIEKKTEDKLEEKQHVKKETVTNAVIPKLPAALLGSWQDSGFFDKKTTSIIRTLHRKEHRAFGRRSLQKLYKKKKYGNHTVMQRSSRKRLYDHNIFLRGVFAGQVKHRYSGSFKQVFKDAVFIDLGSAILYADGAPTVRDIHEDKKVANHLKKIVATDINDPNDKKAQYISHYRKKKKKLPFTVREIPMELGSTEKFRKLTDKVAPTPTPLIFRSANSGPDLFYSPQSVKRHFTAMAQAYPERNVMYFYNRYVLFKPAGSKGFHIIGQMSRVGFDHRRPSWTKVNWRKRRLSRAFYKNRKYML